MTLVAPMKLPQRSLQDKQDEKGRWLRNFLRHQRERWAELCEREPRLVGLRKEIRRTHTPADTLSVVADSWARSADPDVRHAVLRQVDRHASRMARFSGRAALDDPLPPQVNVFILAREMLAVR